jgi:hypothetical protein
MELRFAGAARTTKVGWRQELENLARELGYPVTNVEGIEAKFVAAVEAIATASVN